jgi:hypothetical protein
MRSAIVDSRGFGVRFSRARGPTLSFRDVSIREGSVAAGGAAPSTLMGEAPRVRASS